MTLRIQILIGIIIVIGIMIILRYVKNNKLELKYALSWLIAAVCVLVLDFAPKVMVWLTEIIGIVSPINMIFFLGFCFLLIIMLTMTVALSITASSVKRLTQKVALLEKRVIELEKNTGKEMNDDK